jgi:hypothetical protein
MATLRGAVMGWRVPLGKTLAATIFALACVTLAASVWPQMHRSDLLLREGIRAEATVVALDPDTCVHANSRVNREYPCFRATGTWSHAGSATAPLRLTPTLSSTRVPSPAPMRPTTGLDAAVREVALQH